MAVATPGFVLVAWWHW